jgi:hypothetical protein
MYEEYFRFAASRQRDLGPGPPECPWKVVVASVKKYSSYNKVGLQAMIEWRHLRPTQSGQSSVGCMRSTRGRVLAPEPRPARPWQRPSGEREKVLLKQ